MDIMQVIDDQIKGNKVILYMKGTPQFPQCGFSSKVVEVMGPYDVPFAYVNILDHPEIRSNLPKYANWPTFPQLWVEGELVGGCDIIIEMAQKGELEPILKKAGGEDTGE